jgi:hypothetical protein
VGIGVSGYEGGETDADDGGWTRDDGGGGYSGRGGCSIFDGEWRPGWWNGAMEIRVWLTGEGRWGKVGLDVFPCCRGWFLGNSAMAEKLEASRSRQGAKMAKRASKVAVKARKPAGLDCLDMAFKDNEQLETSTKLHMGSGKLECKVI